MEAGPKFLETLSHVMQHFKTLWCMPFLVCNDIIKNLYQQIFTKYIKPILDGGGEGRICPHEPVFLTQLRNC